jgi:hypothetical protein
MGDPEHFDKMEQVEKTLKASINPENKYADYSDNQKVVFVYYLKFILFNAA